MAKKELRFRTHDYIWARGLDRPWVGHEILASEGIGLWMFWNNPGQHFVLHRVDDKRAQVVGWTLSVVSGSTIHLSQHADGHPANIDIYAKDLVIDKNTWFDAVAKGEEIVITYDDALIPAAAIAA